VVGLVVSGSFMPGRPLRSMSIAALVGRTVKSNFFSQRLKPVEYLRQNVSQALRHTFDFHQRYISDPTFNAAVIRPVQPTALFSELLKSQLPRNRNRV
jgi:hypothetical protein